MKAVTQASDAIDHETMLRRPDTDPLLTFPREQLLGAVESVRGILQEECARGVAAAKTVADTQRCAEECRPWLDATPPDADKLRALRKQVPR